MDFHHIFQINLCKSSIIHVKAGLCHCQVGSGIGLHTTKNPYLARIKMCPPGAVVPSKRPQMVPPLEVQPTRQPPLSSGKAVPLAKYPFPGWDCDDGDPKSKTQLIGCSIKLRECNIGHLGIFVLYVPFASEKAI